MSGNTQIGAADYKTKLLANPTTHIDLETNLIKICKDASDEINNIYCEPRSSETIERARCYIEKYRKLLNTIQKQAEKLVTLTDNCEEFAEGLEDDIDTPRSDDFVYQTKRFMLHYKNNDKNTNLKIKEPPQKIETVAVNLSSFGYSMHLPTVRTMEELHKLHSIYYCEETKSVWMVLPGANLVKIPFPDIVDCTKSTEKTNSIRCRYQSKAICGDNKQGFWTCSYAHTGEKMVKLGYPIRCPSVPNFGNPSTIRRDIQYVKLNDIKSLLMYGLNDVIVAAIWLNYNGKKDQQYDTIDRG